MRLGVQLRSGVLLCLRFLFSSAGFFGMHSEGEHTHDPDKLKAKSNPAINHPNSLEPSALELNSGQEDMSPSLFSTSSLGPVIPVHGDLCLRAFLQHTIQRLLSDKLL